LVAFLKLPTYYENPVSNPQRDPTYSGDFDPENAYRKPPGNLKMVPEAGYDV
jgi:hypothetical protein